MVKAIVLPLIVGLMPFVRRINCCQCNGPVICDSNTFNRTVSIEICEGRHELGNYTEPSTSYMSTFCQAPPFARTCTSESVVKCQHQLEQDMFALTSSAA